MKLNNKGFAISSIMYIILILAVVLISVTLAILSSRKLILDKLRKETTDNIYGISYNSVINTLKHEAISYATRNNVNQENIRIGDFETSVSQDLLEHHELTDKYLTLFKNNYNYDVYLGQTKKVTDISKPIENMIGIADYKIEGNSYQQTYTGKNLFDYDLFFEGNALERGGITYTKTEKGLLVNGATTDAWSTIQAVSVKDLLEVGKTYTITDNINNVQTVFYSKTGEDYSYVKTKTITGNESEIKLYLQVPPNTTINNVLVPLQIEEGTTATSYEPYVGGAASPNPQYPQEIKSVGERTNNLFNKNTITDNKRLLLGNVYDDTQRYISNYIDCSNLDSVSINFAASFAWYDEEKNIVSYENKSSTIFRNYIKPDGAIYLRLDFDKSVVAPENVMIVEGEYTSQTFPEYESYGYKIPVKVGGKNLINPELINQEYTHNGITYKYLEDEDCFLINGTHDESTSSSQLVSSYFVIPNEIGESYTLSATYISGSVEGDAHFFVGAHDTVGNRSNWFNVKLANQNVSKTSTTDKQYITAFWFYNYKGATYNNYKVRLQLEKNKTVTNYEPYVEPVTTNIYLNEPLRKVGDYADYIDFEKRKVFRVNQEYIHDGTEEWMYIETTGFNSHYYALHIGEYGYIISGVGLSTHFETKSIGSSNTIIGYSAINSNGYKDSRILIRPDLSKYNTITLWKEFLDEQYVKGTPLKNYYALATPIEETIELPIIQTNLGASAIEVDTSIFPSNVEFTIIEKIRKL